MAPIRYQLTVIFVLVWVAVGTLNQERTASAGPSPLPVRAVIPAVATDAAAVAALDARASDVIRQSVDRYFSPYAFGETQVFFTFASQRAVLRVQFEPQGFKFSALVFLFGADATPATIARFINNLHSDALAVDAARPTSATSIPAANLIVLSSRLVGHSVGFGGDEYDDYSVRYRITAHTQPGLFALAEVSGETTVHLRTCELRCSTPRVP